MKDKVSIIIPVIRPKNIPALKRMIKKNAGIPETEYEVLTLEDKKRIGAPKMVAKLVELSQYPLVMFIGDDCRPQPDFLKEAVEEMNKLPDRWGLIGLVDTQRPGDHAPAHWLAHKNLLEITGGEFFHTGYIHQFCDNELCLWASLSERYRLAKKSIIDHKHDGFKNKNKTFNQNIADSKDKDIKRVYSNSVFVHDQTLFFQRRKYIINRFYK